MSPKTKRSETKARILEEATALFSEKGYSETSIRDIAAAVGINEASIYNHFSSKNAIFTAMLTDYSDFVASASLIENRYQILKQNPTPEGILSCLAVYFPKDRGKRHLKELFVILQEQHRNPVARVYVAEDMVHQTETSIRLILEALIDLGTLRPDTDIDLWSKIHSSISYTFANRASLGITDWEPGFTGVSMEEMLLENYRMMFALHGTKAGQA